MAKVIGKLKGSYSRLVTDESGDMELCIKVEKNTPVRFVIESMKEYINKGKELFLFTVSPYRKSRSLEQNSMMWVLLETMALHQNGGRTGGVTAWDCYIDMLEKFGAKYEYFMCRPEALEVFKANFRAVKEVECREQLNPKTGELVEMVVCKCFYGSSDYDSEEMTQLIEGILDTMADMGIYTAETEYIRYE